MLGIQSIIVFLIVGAVAGWLAGLIVKGFGFGLLGNIVVGIVGAVIAGWLFPYLGWGVGGGILWAIMIVTSRTRMPTRKAARALTPIAIAWRPTVENRMTAMPRSSTVSIIQVSTGKPKCSV